MALVACKECGNQISKSAKSCPQCGHKQRRTSKFTWIALGLVVVMVGVSQVGAPPSSSSATAAALTPEQKEAKQKADAALQQAMLGAKTLKQAMRNPDSFKLEQALVIAATGAACFEYRAQNGFGGMNRGQAVLTGDGKQFKSSDMDGFARLWKRECEGKSGQDYSRTISWVAL
jgi:RNA polymerase subunit RPABC4/transcription elongation factor Spt4